MSKARAYKQQTYLRELMQEICLYQNFLLFHFSVTSKCHDNASRFIGLLSTTHCHDYVESDDFVPLLQVKYISLDQFL